MDRQAAAENYAAGCQPRTFGLINFMRVPQSALDFPGSTDDPECSGIIQAASLADMVMEFLEDYRTEMPDSSSSGSDEDGEDEDEDGGDEAASLQEKAEFWKKQHQLLEAALCWKTALEKRVSRDMTVILEDAQGSPECTCKKPIAGICQDCLQRDVVHRLRKIGYNAAICISKWRSSPHIPSGEHNYIDVIDAKASTIDPETGARVVIELEFRAEFEMARGSNQYNQLVGRPPKVFVGKPDCLKEVIKLVYSACKRCMKEKKMHLAPWRKHKYMSTKWLGAGTEKGGPARPWPHPEKITLRTVFFLKNSFG